MKRALVAVDGSENSLRAARWVADFCRSYGPIETQVLNAEPAPQAWQTHGMEPEAIADHLRARCSMAIESSGRPLREAGLAYASLRRLAEILRALRSGSYRSSANSLLASYPQAIRPSRRTHAP